MAKSRMFLFFAAVLQKFKFLPAEGKLAPSHDPRTYPATFILLIKDYNVIAQPRCMGEY